MFSDSIQITASRAETANQLHMTILGSQVERSGSILCVEKTRHKQMYSVPYSDVCKAAKDLDAPHLGVFENVLPTG